MSEGRSPAAGTGESETRGVFKSAEMAPQRINAMTNSAVSDVAVERGLEELPNSAGSVVIEPTPTNALPVIEESVSATASVTQSLEDLQASMAKVNEVVQTVEQRQLQIEEAHQKAEAMLAEVSRISAALSFDNALRERIEATIARTRRLRTGLEK